MRADEKGDMGFMESMIAMMAVVLVLSAYLGLLTHSVAQISDPTDGIEASELTGTVDDGAFVPGFEDYVRGYIDSKGLSGASVRVIVPGGFCEDPEPFVIGDISGRTTTASFSSTVDIGDGRTVMAIYEVTLCARAMTGSSP